MNNSIMNVNVSPSKPINVSIVGTGPRGQSAYETWLAQGNTGSEQDFINSLSGDKTYVHDQIAASASWNITHAMGKYPSVTIVDTGGNIVVGDVNYISTTNLIVTFSASFSGKAYLN